MGSVDSATSNGPAGTVVHGESSLSSNVAHPHSEATAESANARDEDAVAGAENEPRGAVYYFLRVDMDVSRTAYRRKGKDSPLSKLWQFFEPVREARCVAEVVHSHLNFSLKWSAQCS